MSGPRSDEDDVETALGRAGTPPSRCAISWSISSRRHIERVADAVCIGLKKPGARDKVKALLLQISDVEPNE